MVFPHAEPREVGGYSGCGYALSVRNGTEAVQPITDQAYFKAVSGGWLARALRLKSRVRLCEFPQERH